MRHLTDLALNTAQVRGATYADIRIVNKLVQSIDVKNGRVEAVVSRENAGFGVRVISMGHGVLLPVPCGTPRR